MRFHAVVVGSVAHFAAACAGASPPPPAELGVAERQLRLAEDFGAPDDPVATGYFALAKSELASSREAHARGEVDVARGWAQRAAADADVAVLTARDTSVRRAARRTQEEAKMLADDLNGDAEKAP